jgi:hypothetical protein
MTPETKARYKKDRVYAPYRMFDKLSPTEIVMLGLKEKFPNASQKDLSAMAGAIFYEVAHRVSKPVSNEKLEKMRKDSRNFQKQVNCTKYNEQSMEEHESDSE